MTASSSGHSPRPSRPRASSAAPALSRAGWRRCIRRAARRPAMCMRTLFPGQRGARPGRAAGVRPGPVRRHRPGRFPSASRRSPGTRSASRGRLPGRACVTTLPRRVLDLVLDAAGCAADIDLALSRRGCAARIPGARPVLTAMLRTGTGPCRRWRSCTAQARGWRAAAEPVRASWPAC